ncbi:MAG: site-specific DNA-methyltransferase [Candidatus Caldatribacteriota bacterium]
MLEINKIYNEDCLEGMKYIDDKSIDMILCDLPYGTTACKWDTIIPFDLLWEQYNRIIKNNGAVLLFAQEPFTSQLISSNIYKFKYKWIWQKTKATGFPMANYRPLKSFEEIILFTDAPCTYTKNGDRGTYNPQGLKECNRVKKRSSSKHLITSSNGGNMESEYVVKFENYPQDIITFSNGKKKNVHPCEKPTDLLEYLIKTYTNENELVLDNCMGSGTTAIACINTNRNYIGFDNGIDDKTGRYWADIANERIKQHIK